MNATKLKVCGLRDLKNIESISTMEVDMIGFIFYDQSKRMMVGDPADYRNLSCEKVGVFVNEEIEKIRSIAESYNCQYVQLHGNETPAMCQELSEEGRTVIKAFSIDDDFCFSSIESYDAYCDYFLFDTKGQHPGGNGIAFNWNNLGKYSGTKPYFLSGGIDLTSVQAIKNLNDKRLFAIDVNSKFEISPGLKNINLLKKFIDELRS